MFKQNLSRRPAPRRFKDSAKEVPTHFTGGFAAEEDVLIFELENSLENLRQAIRRGETAAGKITAVLAGDNDD